MFVAPPEKEVEWTDTGLEGSFRFLARVWRIADHWRDDAPSAARDRRHRSRGADRRRARPAPQDARHDQARDA